MVRTAVMEEDGDYNIDGGKGRVGNNRRKMEKGRKEAGDNGDNHEAI